MANTDVSIDVTPFGICIDGIPDPLNALLLIVSRLFGNNTWLKSLVFWNILDSNTVKFEFVKSIKFNEELENKLPPKLLILVISSNEIEVKLLQLYKNPLGSDVYELGILRCFIFEE